MEGAHAHARARVRDSACARMHLSVCLSVRGAWRWVGESAERHVGDNRTWHARAEMALAW